MEYIFHVTRADDWRAAQAGGTYRNSTRDRTLDEEGFIHCSYAHQVARVVATYFRDVDGLLVLGIDAQRVNSEIRERSAGDDERFPHIYGPLNLDAVIRVERPRKTRRCSDASRGSLDSDT